jgi:hypothetical protein
MNNVCAVRCIQRVSDSDGNFQERLQFNRPSIDALLKSLALEQLHRDEVPAFMFPDVINRADVGVIQRRRCARLAQESLHCSRIAADIFRQELQRHSPAKATVFRSVHNGHPTGADGRLYFVMTKARPC